MKRLTVLGLVMVYVLLLKWSYINLISPEFAYMGYAYAPAELGFEGVSMMLCLLPVAWLPMQVTRPSMIIYWLLYAIVFIPASIFPYYSLSLTAMEILPLSVTMLISFALIGMIYRYEPRELPRPAMRPMAFWTAIMGCWLLLNMGIAWVFGINFRLHALSEVYEARAGFRDGLLESGVGRIVGYAVSWLGHVFNPLLMAYGMLNRRWYLLALGLAGQFFLFSSTAHKSLLLNIFLILALFVGLSRQGRNFGVWMLTGVASLVATGIGVALALDSSTFASLFIRRLLVTPGLLTGYYYEYYTTHPKAMLGHSIFAGLVPVADKPSFVVGEVYFRSSTRDLVTNANANVWADAFANFGFGGIIVFSLLLALVFYLIDCLAKNQDVLLCAALVGIVGITFTSSALLSCLLTHGVLLAMAVMWIMPRADAPSADVSAEAEPGGATAVDVDLALRGERHIIPPLRREST